MSLRRYQRAALDALRAALSDAATHGPDAAFRKATGRAYIPLDGVPDAPCFCLRLPTGAGKTLLAAHAVRVAAETFLERERPLVLWLVTSSAIAGQTLEALRDRRFLPRQALEEGFGPGALRVLDLESFRDLRPQDIAGCCTVLVGTIQSFRVEDEEKRAVYRMQEDWEAHAAALPRPLPDGLRLDAQGRPVPSFANILRALRPLVVVDEAHNVMTGLSREVQRRINPACVLEWTATPRPGQNLLHRTDAAALKAEDMVKLPIRLTEHADWREAVAGAVAERRRLAALALNEGAGIRPIVLYQAEPRNGAVTVEVLKDHLMVAEQVPESAIAVHTGTERGLDSQDLMAFANPVEHVITVQALKEGWDCPFAYVLCSVQRGKSATAAEQLLGRVMRMPFARRQEKEELNCAYAHLPVGAHAEALDALRGTLVRKMGFEAREAEEAVVQQPPGGLFGPGLEDAQAPLIHEVAGSPELAARLAGRADVRVEPLADGRLRLTLTASDPAAAAAVADALPEGERAGFAAALARAAPRRAAPRPATEALPLLLPGLVWPQGGDWVPLDAETLMEDAEWSLSDHPARLSGALEPAEGGTRFRLDVEGGTVTVAQDGRQAALELAEPEHWSEARLAAWLGRELFGRDPAGQDQPEEALADWAAKALHGLRLGGTPPSALARWKFALLRQLREHLAEARLAARRQVYQRGLNLCRADAPAHRFRFVQGVFDGARPYRGPFRPRHHLLHPMPDFDGEDVSEEIMCAMALDALPGLRHWVRNVSRHRNAFRLPLADRSFYPDFVAELEDGRPMVVEYKGAHLKDTPDTAAKAAVGEVWARKAGGVFAMVRGGEDPPMEQLRRAVSA